MSKWIYKSIHAFSNYFNVEWIMSLLGFMIFIGHQSRMGCQMYAWKQEGIFYLFKADQPATQPVDAETGSPTLPRSGIRLVSKQIRHEQVCATNAPPRTDSDKSRPSPEPLTACSLRFCHPYPCPTTSRSPTRMEEDHTNRGFPTSTIPGSGASRRS